MIGCDDHMELTRSTQDNTISFWGNGKQIFSMREELNGDAATLYLEGSLMSSAARDFQDELISIATVGLPLIVDCGGLTHLSAAAQQALLSVQQKIDKLGRSSLILRRLPMDILQEFEKTGMSELLLIEEG